MAPVFEHYGVLVCGPRRRSAGGWTGTPPRTTKETIAGAGLSSSGNSTETPVRVRTADWLPDAEGRAGTWAGARRNGLTSPPRPRGRHPKQGRTPRGDRAQPWKPDSRRLRPGRVMECSRQRLARVQCRAGSPAPFFFERFRGASARRRQAPACEPLTGTWDLVVRCRTLSPSIRFPSLPGTLFCRWEPAAVPRPVLVRPRQHGLLATSGAAVEPARRGWVILQRPPRTRRLVPARRLSTPPRTHVPPPPMGPAGPGGCAVTACRACWCFGRCGPGWNQPWSHGQGTPPTCCRHGLLQPPLSPILSGRRATFPSARNPGPAANLGRPRQSSAPEPAGRRTARARPPSLHRPRPRSRPESTQAARPTASSSPTPARPDPAAPTAPRPNASVHHCKNRADSRTTEEAAKPGKRKKAPSRPRLSG